MELEAIVVLLETTIEQLNTRGTLTIVTHKKNSLADCKKVTGNQVKDRISKCPYWTTGLREEERERERERLK